MAACICLCHQVGDVNTAPNPNDEQPLTLSSQVLSEQKKIATNCRWAHRAFSWWRWRWGPVWLWPGSRRRPPKQPSHRRAESLYLTQPPVCPGVPQPKRKGEKQETKASHPPPTALKCAPFFFFRVKPSACLTSSLVGYSSLLLLQKGSCLLLLLPPRLASHSAAARLWLVARSLRAAAHRLVAGVGGYAV